MENIFTEYWGVMIAALFIVLGFIWIARGRRGRPIDDIEPDMDMQRNRTIGAASEATDAASSTGAVGLTGGDGAADGVLARKKPKAVSETLDALERTADANNSSAVPTAKPAAASPAAPAERPDIAPAVGDADNLQLMKGVGPKLHTRLTELGVTRFDQIAAWTAEDAAKVDRYLGNFKGRITRDNWIDQAGYLARGDRAGFEATYGALGGELR